MTIFDIMKEHRLGQLKIEKKRFSVGGSYVLESSDENVQVWAAPWDKPTPHKNKNTHTNVWMLMCTHMHTDMNLLSSFSLKHTLTHKPLLRPGCAPRGIAVTQNESYTQTHITHSHIHAKMPNCGKLYWLQSSELL